MRGVECEGGGEDGVLRGGCEGKQRVVRGREDRVARKQQRETKEGKQEFAPESQLSCFCRDV